MRGFATRGEQVLTALEQAAVVPKARRAGTETHVRLRAAKSARTPFPDDGEPAISEPIVVSVVIPTLGRESVVDAVLSARAQGAVQPRSSSYATVQPSLARWPTLHN